MTNVLITGGAGFLGSHLATQLVSAEHRVTVVDNYGTSTPENLAHIPRAKLELVEADVSDELPKRDVDIIYHLASYASPDHFIEYGAEIVDANIDGLRNCIDLAVEYNATLVYASTSEVYGDPEVHPQMEVYNGNVDPNGIRAIYDESKRLAEAILRNAVEAKGIDARVARIFNTYGPRMPDDGRVITTFLQQALDGRPLTVYGDGSQTRSFCYVYDLVGGLIQLGTAAEADLSHRVYNLGNPEEVSITELAQTVQRLVDTESELVYTELRADDPKRRQPDIGRAKKEFGYVPTIGLEQGLKQMLVEEF
jgi:UDP-glucuronate decarboxylase